MDIRNIKENEFILLDGAMGTMLQKSGMPVGEIPELLSITNPELIVSIHKAYVEAGSQVVYANTFGANEFKLENTEYTVDEVIKASIKNAKIACEGSDCQVALDLGPIGKLMEPTGDLKFDRAYEIFANQVKAATSGEYKADLVVIETMTDLLETKAALLAVKENCNLPVMCTMTFEENGRTFTGASVSAMALTLGGIGADAIGVNCSLGPAQLLPIVKEILKWTKLPVIVKPNAGLPDPIDNTYDVLPEEFASILGDMARAGVKIFGGCCGTSPEYIKAVKTELTQVFAQPEQIEKQKDKVIPCAVCSATGTVILDQPQIIGERINPTGKKRFKEALKNNDIDYILSQAIEQIDGGAQILDVNVGLPEIDEKEMMVKAVKAIQGITDAPLQIDSTIPEVLEAALRVYSGKPIINSVNGEEKSLNAVLPLAKKYGAAVVGLTLDENGIPKKAEERVEIAKKILNRAMELGIPKEDVFIDCLTLTVSAEQDGAVETLKAVKMVTDDLGLKTVLGVSNISFGLPNRETINTTFLALALESGLTLPIMNPNMVAMTGTVMAYKVLHSIDKNSMDYIRKFTGFVKTDHLVKKSEVLSNAPVGNKKNASINAKDVGNAGMDFPQEEKDELAAKIKYAINSGLKGEGAELTEQLLANREPMDIINNILIPALDEVGDNFEKGKVFLPQLILSADVAKVAFDVIKNYLSKNNNSPVSKGKIVLATVKGDIHDIGKNIVKVILENYGYTVIDLGKDVDPKRIVDAAIEHKVKLVGLSALMTTTLGSMEATIALLRENNVDCKVVVGGAVLTPDYAKNIGADYYAKDAKETVDIAKIVIG